VWRSSIADASYSYQLGENPLATPHPLSSAVRRPTHFGRLESDRIRCSSPKNAAIGILTILTVDAEWIEGAAVTDVIALTSEGASARDAPRAWLPGSHHGRHAPQRNRNRLVERPNLVAHRAKRKSATREHSVNLPADRGGPRGLPACKPFDTDRSTVSEAGTGRPVRIAWISVSGARRCFGEPTRSGTRRGRA
jgi:hypothetical protein